MLATCTRREVIVGQFLSTAVRKYRQHYPKPDKPEPNIFFTAETLQTQRFCRAMVWCSPSGNAKFLTLIKVDTGVLYEHTPAECRRHRAPYAECFNEQKMPASGVGLTKSGFYR
jgi:hypothetical protein